MVRVRSTSSRQSPYSVNCIRSFQSTEVATTAIADDSDDLETVREHRSDYVDTITYPSVRAAKSVRTVGMRTIREADAYDASQRGPHQNHPKATKKPARASRPV